MLDFFIWDDNDDDVVEYVRLGSRGTWEEMGGDGRG